MNVVAMSSTVKKACAIGLCRELDYMYARLMQAYCELWIEAVQKGRGAQIRYDHIGRQTNSPALNLHSTSVLCAQIAMDLRGLRQGSETEDVCMHECVWWPFFL